MTTSLSAINMTLVDDILGDKSVLLSEVSGARKG